MFEILTVMGYDAGTIGNHEFDHGWRKIEKFRALAGFPLLNANAFDEDGKSFGDEPYHVFTTGGVRVGVIGLLSDDMATLTTKDNWGRCKVRSPLKTAKDLVPEVRKQCDVLVLLTHVGVEGDVAIAGAVPGIDLIVGGHSHTELREPIWVACGEKKVPVVQAYRYGERVGIVDFDWDPSAKSVRDLHGRLVAIDPAKMPNATDVKQVCDLWAKKAAEQVDLTEIIGRSAEKLTKAKLRVALERIYAEVLKADFGYQNLHGVRADIPAGDIRVEDIWRVLPFENTLVTFRLKGDQVPAYAKRQLGAGFDASREYVFATNSYAADQMRKYFGVSGVPVEKPGLSMRQTVVDWVRAHKGFGDVAEAPAHDDDEGDGK